MDMEFVETTNVCVKTIIVVPSVERKPFVSLVTMENV